MNISVIVPVYNEEKYLDRCIRSLLSQKYLGDYEIILINDNSNDNSSKILSNYTSNRKINIIYNKDNLGIGESVNIGVKNAIGKYIVRVDADDFVSEYFLQVLHLGITDTCFNSSSCDYFIVNDFGEKISNYISWKRKPIACGLLILKDELIKIGLYSDLREFEELSVNNYFINNNLINYISIPLYRYRNHENNTSFTSMGETLEPC